MNSGKDAIAVEDLNYDEEHSSDDDPEKCDFCKEEFGANDRQETSTAACGHVLHTSCLSEFPNGNPCPVCADLSQDFCQQMKNLKSTVTMLKTSVKDFDSTCSNLVCRGLKIDFCQQVKYLRSKIANLKSAMVKLESTVESCPVCKGMSPNMTHQMERITSKWAKLKTTEAEVEDTVAELKSTLVTFGSTAAA